MGKIHKCILLYEKIIIENLIFTISYGRGFFIKIVIQTLFIFVQNKFNNKYCRSKRNYVNRIRNWKW